MWQKIAKIVVPKDPCEGGAETDVFSPPSACINESNIMIEEKYKAVVLGAGESGVGAALLYQSRGISVFAPTIAQYLRFL